MSEPVEESVKPLLNLRSSLSQSFTCKSQFL